MSPAVSATPAPAVLNEPPPAEVVARRVTLRDVPWSLYERLLALVGDGLPRMTYDSGALGMEIPSKRHEILRWIAGRFIEAYADESSIDYKPAGSTTWRREAVAGGLEADESYYFQNYGNVHGHEVDLTVDPPPDLAVEIDLSPPDVEKASVYARLGVPEIWRWRNARLAVLVRQSDGGYAERPASVALPDFPLPELAAALDAYPRVAAAQAVAAFRRRVRR